MATEGCGENTLECLVDVCGTMCFHSCVSAVQISTMSKSASSIQMLLRNTLNSVGKRNGGSHHKLRKSEEIKTLHYSSIGREIQKVNYGNRQQVDPTNPC